MMTIVRIGRKERTIQGKHDSSPLRDQYYAPKLYRSLSSNAPLILPDQTNTWIAIPKVFCLSVIFPYFLKWTQTDVVILRRKFELQKRREPSQFWDCSTFWLNYWDQKKFPRTFILTFKKFSFGFLSLYKGTCNFLFSMLIYTNFSDNKIRAKKIQVLFENDTFH